MFVSFENELNLHHILRNRGELSYAVQVLGPSTGIWKRLNCGNPMSFLLLALLQHHESAGGCNHHLFSVQCPLLQLGWDGGRLRLSLQSLYQMATSFRLGCYDGVDYLALFT